MKTGGLGRVLLLAVVLWLSPQIAWGVAEQPEIPSVAQVADSLGLEEMEGFLAEADAYLEAYLPRDSLADLWQQVQSGELHFSLEGLWQLFGALFFKEVVAGGSLLVQMIALAMVAMILTNLKGEFGQDGVATLAHSLVYLVLIGLALQAFVLAANLGKEAITLMSHCVYALSPILLTLLVAMGGVSTVGFFHPAMLGAVGIGTNIIHTVIFPLVYFSGILVVVSYISPRLNFDKMAKLLRDIALGLLTIMLTLFTTLLGLVGIAGASINGLTIKAAKSASGLFIPIVGRAIADVMDTLIGTSLVLKNGIGLVGVLAIILICVFPALKILVMGLIFRLGAAFVQPLGDARLADSLQGLASVLMTFFAIVVAGGIFFFFLISIIVGMGNVTMAIG